MLKLKPKKAQSMLEYVILFGAVTAAIAVALAALAGGGGTVPSTLRTLAGG